MEDRVFGRFLIKAYITKMSSELIHNYYLYIHRYEEVEGVSVPAIH